MQIGFFEGQFIFYFLGCIVVLITHAKFYNRADNINQSLNIPPRATTTALRYYLGFSVYLCIIFSLFQLIYGSFNGLYTWYVFILRQFFGMDPLTTALKSGPSADARIIFSTLFLLVLPNMPLLSRFNRKVLQVCYSLSFVPVQLHHYAKRLSDWPVEFNQKLVELAIKRSAEKGVDLREEDFSAPADSIYFIWAKISYLYHAVQSMTDNPHYYAYARMQNDVFQNIENEYMYNHILIAQSRTIADLDTRQKGRPNLMLSGTLREFYKNLTVLLCSMLLYHHSTEKQRDASIKHIWINWETDRKVAQTTTPAFQTCIKFLNAGQNRVKRGAGTDLLLRDAPGRLKSFTPITAMVAENLLTSKHIDTIVDRANRISESEKEKAGILIYKAPPDTRIRMRIAEARLTHHVHIIPIPYAHIELAAGDVDAYDGILLEFAERYMPGANLFDDRNAIGDTMSFFGRTDLLLKLYEDLVRLQSIGLFGLRKSGKTSIILQLAYYAKKHPIVHIDLQKYEGHRFFGAEVFNDILSRLNKIVSERDRSIQAFLTVKEEKSAAHYTQEFTDNFNFLADRLKDMGYKLPVLCFFDEMERVIPHAADPSEKALDFNTLYGALRALSQKERNLAIMVVDLHPDCNRINHWPQEHVSTNPVYSFFKEVYVTPFNLEETCRMIEDTGKLMGRDFDEQTKEMIHRESGGIPFLSRQLASTLYLKIQPNDGVHIKWTETKPIISKSIKYSGIIRDYFLQSVWVDLEKRERLAEMAILRLLAADAKQEKPLSETIIASKLTNMFTQSQMADGMTWLDSNGLIKREVHDNEDHYSIQPFLFTRWLYSHMSEKEREKWKI